MAVPRLGLDPLRMVAAALVTTRPTGIVRLIETADIRALEATRMAVRLATAFLSPARDRSALARTAKVAAQAHDCNFQC